MGQIIVNKRYFTYSGCFWDTDMKLCKDLRIMVLKYPLRDQECVRI